MGRLRSRGRSGRRPGHPVGAGRRVAAIRTEVIGAPAIGVPAGADEAADEPFHLLVP
jgi:hypothetical protein